MTSDDSFRQVIEVIAWTQARSRAQELLTLLTQSGISEETYVQLQEAYTDFRRQHPLLDRDFSKSFYDENDPKRRYNISAFATRLQITEDYLQTRGIFSEDEITIAHDYIKQGLLDTISNGITLDYIIPEIIFLLAKKDPSLVSYAITSCFGKNSFYYCSPDNNYHESRLHRFITSLDTSILQEAINQDASGALIHVVHAIEQNKGKIDIWEGLNRTTDPNQIELEEYLPQLCIENIQRDDLAQRKTAFDILTQAFEKNEHYKYGAKEVQLDWKTFIAILPQGPTEGNRAYEISYAALKCIEKIGKMVITTEQPIKALEMLLSTEYVESAFIGLISIANHLSEQLTRLNTPLDETNQEIEKLLGKVIDILIPQLNIRLERKYPSIPQLNTEVVQILLGKGFFTQQKVDKILYALMYPPSEIEFLRPEEYPHHEITFSPLKQDAIILLGLSGLISKQTGIKISQEYATLEFTLNNSHNVLALFKDQDVKHITAENWHLFLSVFFAIHNDPNPQYNPIKEQVESVFKDQRNLQAALDHLRQEWEDVLSHAVKDGEIVLPMNLKVVLDTLENNTGTHLKFIEGLGTFINTVFEVMRIHNFNPEQVKDLAKRILDIEKKFSSKDIKITGLLRTQFYNISKDILEADPSMFYIFLDYMQNLPKKDLERMLQNQYANFQTALMLIQTSTAEDKPQHDSNKLKELTSLLQSSLQASNMTVDQRLTSLEENIGNFIRREFKNKFGLITIPEQFTEEQLQMVRRFSRYFANLAQRTSEKESVLSLFLALSLFKKWDTFKSGEQVDITTYFEGEKLTYLQQYFEVRGQIMGQFFSYLHGVEIVEQSRFLEILQRDTLIITERNVQTIDAKLQNLYQIISDLQDPDLYQALATTNVKASELVSLINMIGSRIVNQTLAEMYQGKTVTNLDVKRALEKIFMNISPSGEIPREIIKEAQAFSTLVGRIINLGGKSKTIPDRIEKFEQLLLPSEDIVRIFRSIGEEFQTGSGAKPLPLDLGYLKDLIARNQDNLQPNEYIKLHEYLASIETELGNLEELFLTLSKEAVSLAQTMRESGNQILQTRASDIANALAYTKDRTPLVSEVTGNFLTIIENIRQCLGCMSTEINNDTNLTFGDTTKLYISSRGEEKGHSISDQIIFVLPVNYNGKDEISFVLDNVYGQSSPDILLGQVLAAYKKYRQLKHEFPQSNISILVSDAAIHSAGTTQEIFREMIANTLEAEDISMYVGAETTFAIVLPSASGQHYVEFNYQARYSYGNLPVGGLRIGSQI